MDDGNADVYFVERNASVVNDHRATRPTFPSSSRSPAYMPAAVASQPRVTYAGPASMFTQPQYAPQYAPQFASQGFFGGNQPVYAQPPVWGMGQQGTLGGLFSGLNNVNIGTLVDLIGQGFAALRALPLPPPQGSEGVDVGNLALYQQALAEHGKADEQIRTAVHIIGKLLGG